MANPPCAKHATIKQRYLVAAAGARRSRPRANHVGCQQMNIGAEYDAEQIAFLMAVDQFKRANRRPFPTWTDVLAIARSLGYRLVEQPTALPTVPAGPHRHGRPRKRTSVELVPVEGAGTGKGPLNG